MPVYYTRLLWECSLRFRCVAVATGVAACRSRFSSSGRAAVVWLRHCAFDGARWVQVPVQPAARGFGAIVTFRRNALCPNLGLPESRYVGSSAFDWIFTAIAMGLVQNDSVCATSSPLSRSYCRCERGIPPRAGCPNLGRIRLWPRRLKAYRPRGYIRSPCLRPPYGCRVAWG